MRALRLDYCDGKRMLTITGWLAFAVSVVLAASLGVQQQQLNRDLAQQQLRIDRLENRIHQDAGGKSANLIAPERMVEAVKFSNTVIRQLNLPWDVLFAQLEKTDDQHVALLSLEPDAHRSVLKITGEARDYQGMLQFLRDLKSSGELSEVYLLEHKMDELNPEKPVHFELETKWITKS
jgi:Tfp pilus assembly protein PilN